MELAPNPIYRRLTRHAGWPTIQETVAILMTTSLLSLVLMAIAFMQAQSELIQGALFLALATYLILPLLSTITGSWYASREANDPHFTMLQLTPMTDRQLVRGYVWAALHAWRGILAFALGLIPIFMISLIYLHLEALATLGTDEYATFCNVRTYNPDCSPRYLTPGDETALLLESLLFLPIGLVMWSMNVCGAALGVHVGLSWRRREMAIFVAIFFTLIAMSMAGLPWLVYIFFAGYLEPTVNLLLALVLGMVSALVIGWVTFRSMSAAERFVRKET
jgi:hypothetical protein